MRRIQINKPIPINNSTQPDKQPKDKENVVYKSADVNSGQLSNGVANKVVARTALKHPNSSAQFYRTWREQRENSQKYSYLKVRYAST